MAAHLSNEDVILKANAELENSWASIMEISRIIGSDADNVKAIHKVMSYNPQNKAILSSNKKLYDAIRSVCNIAKDKVESISKNPESAPTWVIIAHCYIILCDYSNAYTAVAHVLRIDESINDPYFWFTAGIVHQHFSYFSTALQYFKKVLQIDQSFPLKSDLIFRQAILQRTLCQFDESLSLFNSILSNPPPSFTEDDIRFHIAFTHQLAGRIDIAHSIYRDLHSKYPSCIEVSQQYSWSLSLQSDARSISLANHVATSVSPEFSEDPIILFVLARIALQQKDINTAYKRFKQILNAWPDSPLFWCCLGNLYFQNSQFNDAVVAYQRALVLQNSIVEAWLNFGLIFQKQGDNQSAMKIYQTAMGNCNNSPIIQERIESINNQRAAGKQPQILEINDNTSNKLFVQVAERVSNSQLCDPPILPPKCFGVGDEFGSVLNEVNLKHMSLF